MIRSCWTAAAAIAVATVVGSAASYSYLPQRVPSHWNLRGEVDGYASRESAAFLLPFILLLLLGFLAILPRVTPRSLPIEPFQATYAYIAFLTTGMLAYMHAITLLAATGHMPRLERGMLGGLYVFFALMGNVMGKVTRNPWVGIRIPWTLASERNWNATHRIAAYCFTLAGVLGLLLLVLGATWWLSLAPLILALFVPVAYSYGFAFHEGKPKTEEEIASA